MSNKIFDDVITSNHHLHPFGAGFLIGAMQWMVSASGDLTKAFLVGAVGALGAFLMNKATAKWGTKGKGS